MASDDTISVTMPDGVVVSGVPANARRNDVLVRYYKSKGLTGAKLTDAISAATRQKGEAAPPKRGGIGDIAREAALGALGTFVPETMHPIRDLGRSLLSQAKPGSGNALPEYQPSSVEDRFSETKRQLSHPGGLLSRDPEEAAHSLGRVASLAGTAIAPELREAAPGAARTVARGAGRGIEWGGTESPTAIRRGGVPVYTPAGKAGALIGGYAGMKELGGGLGGAALGGATGGMIGEDVVAPLLRKGGKALQRLGREPKAAPVRPSRPRVPPTATRGPGQSGPSSPFPTAPQTPPTSTPKVGVPPGMSEVSNPIPADIAKLSQERPALPAMRAAAQVKPKAKPPDLMSEFKQKIALQKGNILKAGAGAAVTYALYKELSGSKDTSGDLKEAGLGLLGLIAIGKASPEALRRPEATAYVDKSLAVVLNTLPTDVVRSNIADVLTETESIHYNPSGGLPGISPGIKTILKALLDGYREVPRVREVMDGVRRYIHGSPFNNASISASSDILRNGGPTKEGADAIYRLLGTGESDGVRIPLRMLDGHIESVHTVEDFYKGAQAIIDTIKASEPRNVRLTRGIHSWDMLDSGKFLRLKPSDSTGDLLQRLSSFSESKTISRQFAMTSTGDPAASGVYSVVLELKGPVRALNVSPGSWYPEKEVLTFGDFEVVSVNDVKGSSDAGTPGNLYAPHRRIILRQLGPGSRRRTFSFEKSNTE